MHKSLGKRVKKILKFLNQEPKVCFVKNQEKQIDWKH